MNIKIVNEKIAKADFNYINSITGKLITDDDTHTKLMYATSKLRLLKILNS